MNRIFVVFAVALAALLSVIGLAVSSASAPHPSRAAYPNFVCVSTPYFGVCVGPPTKQG